jgi:hypothetical protein
MNHRDSYFPAVVRYINDVEDTVVNTPGDIRPGIAFSVIQIAPTADGRQAASPFDLGCTCQHCSDARIAETQTNAGLNIEELTTRQTEYLGEVRRALSRSKSVSDAQERIREAQASYIAWFAERGITAYIP